MAARPSSLPTTRIQSWSDLESRLPIHAVLHRYRQLIGEAAIESEAGDQPSAGTTISAIALILGRRDQAQDDAVRSLRLHASNTAPDEVISFLLAAIPAHHLDVRPDNKQLRGIAVEALEKHVLRNPSDWAARFVLLTLLPRPKPARHLDALRQYDPGFMEWVAPLVSDMGGAETWAAPEYTKQFEDAYIGSQAWTSYTGFTRDAIATWLRSRQPHALDVVDLGCGSAVSWDGILPLLLADSPIRAIRYLGIDVDVRRIEAARARFAAWRACFGGHGVRIDADFDTLGVRAEMLSKLPPDRQSDVQAPLIFTAGLSLHHVSPEYLEAGLTTLAARGVALGVVSEIYFEQDDLESGDPLFILMNRAYYSSEEAVITAGHISDRGAGKEAATAVRSMFHREFCNAVRLSREYRAERFHSPAGWWERMHKAGFKPSSVTNDDSLRRNVPDGRMHEDGHTFVNLARDGLDLVFTILVTTEASTGEHSPRS